MLVGSAGSYVFTLFSAYLVLPLWEGLQPRLTLLNV